MSSATWQGVFPAVTTQFQSDESLDLPATLAHVEAMLEAGVDGLVFLGTVGENCSLEAAEKREILKAAVDHVAGRVPVLTGVAEYTTGLACRFAADALKARGGRVDGPPGDGLQVGPARDPGPTSAPWPARPNCRSWRTTTRSRTASTSRPAMFAELADEPTIICIKESSEDPRRITDLKNEVGDRYILFCGVDDLVMESFILGATGWVSGLVNAFPRENRLLWDLLMAGKFDEARAVYRWYTPLLHLDTLPKLVQYIKLAAAECGYGTETVRAPRMTIAGKERDGMLKIIRQAIATRPKALAQV